jgi:hypothetical protein
VNATEMTRLCRLWQRRLRLQDWDVTTKLMAEEDAPGEFGCANMEPSELKAFVTIRDCEAAEATLVHELLHLRLVCFGEDDTEEKQVAMNLLADALVRAYPKRKGKR